MRFELGEGQLNRIEIGAVVGQKRGTSSRAVSGLLPREGICGWAGCRGLQPFPDQAPGPAASRCMRYASKADPFIAPLITQGAITASCVNPATSVCVTCPPRLPHSERESAGIRSRAIAPTVTAFQGVAFPLSVPPHRSRQNRIRDSSKHRKRSDTATCDRQRDPIDKQDLLASAFRGYHALDRT